MNFADDPPTIEYRSTFLGPTAPAATMASSPTVTPGQMTAQVQIQASLQNMDDHANESHLDGCGVVDG